MLVYETFFTIKIIVFIYCFYYIAVVNFYLNMFIIIVITYISYFLVMAKGSSNVKATTSQLAREP